MFEVCINKPQRKHAVPQGRVWVFPSAEPGLISTLAFWWVVACSPVVAPRLGFTVCNREVPKAKGCSTSKGRECGAVSLLLHVTRMG